MLSPSVKVLMSGPIRPTSEDVVDVLRTMKRQLPNSTIFLCTWAGQATDEVRKCVDYCFEVPEPTQSEIDRIVHARTRQQRQLGDQLRGWTYAIYRMVYGVRTLCELARPYLQEDDLVMRIRTDTPFLFDQSYLHALLPTIGSDYVIRDRKSGGGFDDWFAITRFNILQETWTFKEYNASIEAAWNAEDLIRRNLSYPIRLLDSSKVECYIKRPNGARNYHA